MSVIAGAALLGLAVAILMSRQVKAPDAVCRDCDELLIRIPGHGFVHVEGTMERLDDEGNLDHVAWPILQTTEV